MDQTTSGWIHKGTQTTQHHTAMGILLGRVRQGPDQAHRLARKGEQFERAAQTRICQLTDMESEANLSVVTQFLKSIYLGDRACKGYSLDSWKREFRVQVDEISRVRGLDGQWNYYNDENIVNGSLAFSGVKSVKFDPPGLMPNDYIEILGVQSEAGQLRFRLELGCVGEDALTTVMTVEVVATDVYLESPCLPGVEVR